MLSIVCASVASAQNVEFISAHFQDPFCIVGYDSAGVEVARSQGVGQYNGVAFDPAGNWVATRLGSNKAVAVFSPTGALIRSFATPQINYPTDCAVFGDGTIAVCDWWTQGDGTHLFSPLGAHLGTLPTGPVFSCKVDPLDRLWVCTFSYQAPSSVSCFSRSGALITTFATTAYVIDFDFEPGGDLWLWGGENRVSRWTNSGAFVSSFVTVNFGSKHGIARMLDGTLWVTHDDFLAERYAPNGTRLQSMPFPENAGSLESRRESNSATSYCTAGTTTNGCVASIWCRGVPSVSGAVGFEVTVSNVEGQKQGIILYGVSGRATAPWGSSSSLLCVKAPAQRTAVIGSAGAANACNGTLVLDVDAYMAAHPFALGAPFLAGGRAFFQGWFRDPPSAKSSSLSNALEVVLAP